MTAHRARCSGAGKCVWHAYGGAPEDTCKARQPPKKRRAPKIEISGATPEQIERWRAAAEREGLALAAWLRAAADGALLS